MARRRWFRDEFRDAVWSPNALRPNEKLIALAYAEYAGDRTNPDNNVAWVGRSTLSDMTGIRSRDAIWRATLGLIEAGWLVLEEPARQHRSPRYRLVIPADPEVRATYVSDASTA